MTARSRYLVQVRVSLPPDMPRDERARLMAAEAARGRELVADGTIEGIWRVVGAPANVGIWAAASGDDLHRCLVSLPLYPWLLITVTPLAIHPVMEEAPA